MSNNKLVYPQWLDRTDLMLCSVIYAKALAFAISLASLLSTILVLKVYSSVTSHATLAPSVRKQWLLLSPSPSTLSYHTRILLASPLWICYQTGWSDIYLTLYYVYETLNVITVLFIHRWRHRYAVMSPVRCLVQLFNNIIANI